MRYEVVLLPQAERDAAEHAAYIAEKSPSAAVRWLENLETEVAKLAEMPGRFPFIPERGPFSRDFRQFLFHSHRLIFFIDEEESRVAVARIYHSARDILTVAELTEEE